MTATISVLLVDDHAVVREGYKRLLERSGDIVVVGEAASAADAYTQASTLEPNVIVMDIALPGASGIEALRRIRARQPDSRVLMFSMYSDAIFARRALEAGATGYLSKASAPETLIEAVRSVARNEQYLSRDIAQALELQAAQPSEAAEVLSPREFEVLRLWLQGLGSAEIAQALSLSQKTVSNHQTAIKQKLHVDTHAQLWHTAIRLGLAPDNRQ